MKAHELFSSPDTWCRESPAKDLDGNKVPALHPGAVRRCALAAIQRSIRRWSGDGRWTVSFARSAFPKKEFVS
jgi:hypothetical protein